MSTPVATIADALIAFILSLLRDPSAVEEFSSAPQQVLADHGLQNACAADVKAVAPVIIDDPSVVSKSPGSPPPGSPGEPTPLGNPPEPSEQAITEINRILNQFTTIDNRSTIVDQSTNQNIWAEGDVSQIFDQDAVVSSGDDAVAAGDDVAIDESESTVTTGDIAVGNTTGSHNTTSTGDASDAASTAAADAAAAGADDASSSGAGDVGADAAQAATDLVPDVEAAPATAPPVAEAPAEAEPLMDDLTTDSYDTGEPLTPPEPEPYPEDLAEEE